MSKNRFDSIRYGLDCNLLKMLEKKLLYNYVLFSFFILLDIPIKIYI